LRHERAFGAGTTGIGLGLLLNFGAHRLEFKRRTRTYRPKHPSSVLILSILFILSEAAFDRMDRIG
jgi:hypothetical protein